MGDAEISPFAKSAAAWSTIALVLWLKFPAMPWWQKFAFTAVGGGIIDKAIENRTCRNG